MAFMHECRMIFLLIKKLLFRIIFSKLQNFGKVLNQNTGLKMRIVKIRQSSFFLLLISEFCRTLKDAHIFLS